MERKNETLAELKAIFPQHSWNTISYIFDNVSEITGHDNSPFVLPSCIERLLELPDGCDSSSENISSTKTQIKRSTETSNYRNLLNSSTSFPDSMKNILQDLQAFPNSQVPVYRDKNYSFLSSDMRANNDLSSNNSLVLSTKHDPFVSESDDSSLVSKEIEILEKEPTKTARCALNNKRCIATNSNETSLIISSSGYLAGSSSRKRNLKISEKTSDIIQHTAQKNNFAEPRSSSKKKVKNDEISLQKRLTCIPRSWKEGIADLDSNTSISFCSKTVSLDSELSESSNKKLKFDTPKSMGSFTVNKHNQTPRKSLVTSTHIPKPSPSSISNTVNTDLFPSTCKPVMAIKPSVKSIEHDIINKVSCNLSDQINPNLLLKGMNGFVDSVLKQISCIFPDVDQEYLKQKIDEQPENMSLSEAVNRVATILLDSKQYPKLNATKPLPLKSKQILKYLESPTYSKQAVKVLQNEFPQVLSLSFDAIVKMLKISTSVIKRLLLLQDFDYKQTHTLIEGEFKKIRDEGKKPSETLICFLMRKKRVNMKLPVQLDFMLEKDIDELKEERKRKCQENDYHIAMILNSEQYSEEEQAIECGCCYGDVAFEEMVQCLEGHLFCMDCLRCYSNEAVFGNSKVGLVCMTGECESTFPLSQLQKCLPENVLEKYFERVQDEDIKLASLDNLVRCPNCNFAAEMPDDDKVFRCQRKSCMQETCRYCKVNWSEHFGLPCREVERKEETSLRTVYEEKMTQAKVRACWQCKTMFLKSSGCNKMTCRCGAKMCYICRQPKVDYNHFCQHLREPGQNCGVCTSCSLWTDPTEDDNRAVAEIQKEADEERKKLTLAA